LYWWWRRQMDQRARPGCAGLVNRRAISLRVRGISCGGGGLGVLGGRGHGEEGQGEHGQGGPPVPGRPVPDLMLVQTCQALPGLEILLGGPPEPGDLDQGGQRDRVRAVATVEGQFPGSPTATDQQLAAAGADAGDGDLGPVVPAVALGSLPRRSRCQARAGGPPAWQRGWRARLRLVSGGRRIRLARVRSAGLPARRAAARCPRAARRRPPRPLQQVLHPIRGRLPGLLGDRPAVLARQPGQQPEHERPRPPPRLHPSETSPDPQHQLIEQPQPAGRVYAVASGHQKIVIGRHKPG
jgi:hypothetical protein